MRDRKRRRMRRDRLRMRIERRENERKTHKSCALFPFHIQHNENYMTIAYL